MGAVIMREAREVPRGVRWRHTWRWGGDQRVTGGDRRVTGGGHGGAVVCTLPLRVPIMALALSL